MTMQRSNAFRTIEPLEPRTLLSGGSANAAVYPPHANVAGQSMEQWAADWWAKVFETPVHAPARGHAPNLDATARSVAVRRRDVFFLFPPRASTTTNSARTSPCPRQPIFVPVRRWSSAISTSFRRDFPGGTGVECGAREDSASPFAGPLRAPRFVDGRAVRGLTLTRGRAVTYTCPRMTNPSEFRAALSVPSRRRSSTVLPCQRSRRAPPDHVRGTIREPGDAVITSRPRSRTRSRVSQPAPPDARHPPRRIRRPFCDRPVADRVSEMIEL